MLGMPVWSLQASMMLFSSRSNLPSFFHPPSCPEPLSRHWALILTFIIHQAGPSGGHLLPATITEISSADSCAPKHLGGHGLWVRSGPGLCSKGLVYQMLQPLISGILGGPCRLTRTLQSAQLLPVNVGSPRIFLFNPP